MEFLVTISSNSFIKHESLLSNALIIRELLYSNLAIIKKFSKIIVANSYILEYTTANPLDFDFAPDATTGTVKQTYREPKLKHICDHVLNGVQYTLNTCKRCIGNGYYYDIKIGSDGDILQVSGVNKLQQELEKIIITTIGDNTYHNLYGTDLHKSNLGLTSVESRETNIKTRIVNSVLRIKMLQTEEIRKGNSFSADELINNIQKIDVFDIYGSPTSIGYRVYIKTHAGIEIIADTLTV